MSSLMIIVLCIIAIACVRYSYSAGPGGRPRGGIGKTRRGVTRYGQFFVETFRGPLLGAPLIISSYILIKPYFYINILLTKARYKRIIL